MKVKMTLFGPIGFQRNLEHKGTSLKTCVEKATEDLKLLEKEVDGQRKHDWQKLEVVIERDGQAAL